MELPGALLKNMGKVARYSYPYLRLGEWKLTATDSSLLVELHDKEQVDSLADPPIMVELPQLRSQPTILTVKAGCCQISQGAWSIMVPSKDKHELVEEKVAGAWPKGDPVVQLTLSVEQLQRLLAVVQRLPGTAKEQITMKVYKDWASPSGKLSPVVFEAGGPKSKFAVVAALGHMKSDDSFVENSEV